jgi:hypothetical protein
VRGRTSRARPVLSRLDFRVVKRPCERSRATRALLPLFVIGAFGLSTTASLRDAGEEWRFPGLTAAQGAFATERPYEAFVALGHIAPGAAYLVVGDPEAPGSALGGSRRWIEEQLIGTARASSVSWLPEASPSVDALDLAAGTRRWEGHSTLFGSLEVHALELPVVTFVVVPDRSPGGVTHIIDVRLFDPDGVLR